MCFLKSLELLVQLRQSISLDVIFTMLYGFTDRSYEVS